MADIGTPNLVCKEEGCGEKLKWAHEAEDELCGMHGPGSAHWQERHGETKDRPAKMHYTPEELKRRILNGESLPPSTIPPGKTLRIDE